MTKKSGTDWVSWVAIRQWLGRRGIGVAARKCPIGIVLLCFSLNALLSTDERFLPRVSAASEAQQVEELMNSLPGKSTFRRMLEHGMRGDGTHYPWMDKMRAENLKLAKMTVEFTWDERGRRLSDWNVVSRR